MPPKQNKPVQQSDKIGPISVTMDEVGQHNKKDDFWMVVEGKVYDLTTFVNQHPGGPVIQTHAGVDGTDVFYAFHPDSASELLGNYYIGDVINYQPTPIMQGYRDLRRELKELGAFTSNSLYYVYKNFSNFSIWALSVYTIINYGYSMWGTVIAAIMMSFYWQQMGWLSHDYLHHQVFEDRSWANISGYILGNVAQGFSVSWWKNKHNTHHAAPNIIEYDSDIDTLPLLAWSESLLRNYVKSHPLTPVAAFIVKNQHLFYFPLLFVARVSWALQSLLYGLNNTSGRKWLLEASTLAVHYAWYLGIAFYFMPVKHAVYFILITQSFGGFLLGVVFSLGHNGMDVYDSSTLAKADFASIQIRTGRDISGFFSKGDGLQFFVSWLMGGLHYQVVHHLFPAMPRHNLALAAKKVEEFSRRFKLPYYSTTFANGTNETFQRLMAVGSIVSKIKDD